MKKTWLAKALMCLSLFALIVLTVLFFADIISWVKFAPVAAVLLLIFAVTFLGADTITKINFLGASIERDVNAAKAIRDDTRKLAKLIVEVSRASSANALMVHSNERAPHLLEETLKELEQLAEPDEHTRKQWQARMAKDYA